MDIFPPASTGFHSCDTSFTFAKDSFPGILSFSLEWLPDFFQDNFKVPHLSNSLSLVLCHRRTPSGMTGTLGRVKLFYILLTVLPVLTVFVNRAFLIGWCFVIGWSAQRPPLFLGVIWEEMWGEGIGKRVCKQVDALHREEEPEAACTRIHQPIASSQNAEPRGPEMEVRDLSCLEHKYVPEGETARRV